MLHGVDILLGPASNSGVIGEQLTSAAGKVEGVAQHGGSLLAGDGLVGLEGAVLIAGNDTIFSTEGNGAVGPRARGHILKGGIHIVRIGGAQNVGDHSGELSAGDGTGGTEGAVAVAGNVTVSRGLHHVGIVPGIGAHIGEPVAQPHADGVLGRITLVLSNNSHLAGGGEVHIGVAGEQGFALEFGVIDGNNSTLRDGVVGSEIGVLGAVGQSNGDGLAAVVDHSGVAGILLKVEGTHGAAGVGGGHSQVNGVLLVLALAVFVGDSQHIPHSGILGSGSVVQDGSEGAIPIVDHNGTVTVDEEEGVAIAVVGSQGQVVVVIVHGQVVGNVHKHAVAVGTGGGQFVAIKVGSGSISDINTQHKGVGRGAVLQVHRVPGLGVIQVAGESVGDSALNHAIAAESGNGQGGGPAGAVHQAEILQEVVLLGVSLGELKGVLGKQASVVSLAANGVPDTPIDTAGVGSDVPGFHHGDPHLLTEHNDLHAVGDHGITRVPIFVHRAKIVLEGNQVASAVHDEEDTAVGAGGNHRVNGHNLIIAQLLDIRPGQHDINGAVGGGSAEHEAILHIGSGVEVVKETIVEAGEVGDDRHGHVVQSGILLAFLTGDLDVVRSGHGRQLFAGHMEIQGHGSTGHVVDVLGQVGLIANQGRAGARQGLSIVKSIGKGDGGTNGLGVEQVPASQLVGIVHLIGQGELDKVDAVLGDDLALIIGAIGAPQGDVGEGGLHKLVGHGDLQGVPVLGEAVLRLHADLHLVGAVHNAVNRVRNNRIAGRIAVAVAVDFRSGSGLAGHGELHIGVVGSLEGHGHMAGAVVQVGDIGAHGHGDVDGLSILIDHGGLAADGQVMDEGLVVQPGLEEVHVVGTGSFLTVVDLQLGSVGGFTTFFGVILHVLHEIMEVAGAGAVNPVNLIGIGAIVAKGMEVAGGRRDVAVDDLRSADGHGIAAVKAGDPRAGVIQGKLGSDGDSALVVGITPGQQHGNIAGIGEQHGIQSLLGGKGHKAGSGGDVDGVVLGAAVVGDGHGVAILNRHVGIAVGDDLLGGGFRGVVNFGSAHASVAGQADRCSGAGQFQFADAVLPALHVGSVVIGHGEVDIIGLDDGFAQLHVGAGGAVQRELGDGGVGGHIHGIQQDGVVQPGGRLVGIRHGELDLHIPIAVQVSVAVGSLNREPPNVAFASDCRIVSNGVIRSRRRHVGVPHAVARGHKHVYNNVLGQVGDITGVGVGSTASNKLHVLAAGCHVYLL